MSELVLQSRDARAVLRGMSAELFEALALPLLRERGWIFSRPAKNRERLIDICRRLDVSHMTIRRRLDHPDCPPVEIEYSRGKQQQIRFVHTNQALDAFITEYSNRRQPAPIS